MSLLSNGMRWIIFWVKIKSVRDGGQQDKAVCGKERYAAGAGGVLLFFAILKKAG